MYLSKQKPRHRFAYQRLENVKMYNMQSLIKKKYCAVQEKLTFSLKDFNPQKSWSPVSSGWRMLK